LEQQQTKVTEGNTPRKARSKPMPERLFPVVKKDLAQRSSLTSGVLLVAWETHELWQFGTGLYETAKIGRNLSVFFFF
jgi:hypothetical protein